MAIYKRGQIYWYKFTFNGEAIRESTRQKNQVRSTEHGIGTSHIARQGRGGHPRQKAEYDFGKILR